MFCLKNILKAQYEQDKAAYSLHRGYSDKEMP